MSGQFLSRVSVMQLLEAIRPEPHHPMSATIEVADRCNETCVHCYQVQGQKGELDTDSWRKILDELAEMGVLVLTISGGEATLRHDFLELVAYARQKSFAVKIYTNGLKVSAELASQLGALAVQEVQITLYSHEASVHDAVTCVPGSFDKAVAAAGYLRDAGVAVVLKTPLMSMNTGGLDEYMELVTSLGADYMVDPSIDPREDGDAGPEALRVDDKTYLEILDHPKLSSDEKRVAGPLDESVCGACSGHVHIEANGEMRPCSALQVSVGHALDDGVQEAWSNNDAGLSIRGTTWNDLPGCRECDLRSHCVRCFANARVEVGDALAPYASACRKARLHWQAEHGLAPKIAAAEGIDPGVGPYRKTGVGEFEPVVHPRPDGGSGVRRSWVYPPQELVQLRFETARAEADGTIAPAKD